MELQANKEWYQKDGWIITLLILLAPVGIFLLWRYSRWDVKTKKIATVASAAFFLVALVASQLQERDRRRERNVAGTEAKGEAGGKRAAAEPAAPTGSAGAKAGAGAEDEQRASSATTTAPSSARAPSDGVVPVPSWFNEDNVVPYEIVSTDDNSMKALTKPLSSYSSQEIRALPVAKRTTHRVLVSPDVTKEQARATLVQVVRDQCAKDPDIDAMFVFAFDRRQDADSAYTVGRLIWGPNGQWGGVTPEIARSNSRSLYTFDIDINQNVGKKEARPTAREFAVHDALEKELWKDAEEPEEKVTKRVARTLKMKPAEVTRIYVKVETWKMR